MPDTNQPFENFEKCKAEIEIEPKEMKIALLGTVQDFQKKIDWINTYFPYSHFSIPIAFNLSAGFFEAGNLHLARGSSLLPGCTEYKEIKRR